MIRVLPVCEWVDKRCYQMVSLCFSLIALVFPFPSLKLSPVAAFPPLITLTLLYTVEYRCEIPAAFRAHYRYFDFALSSWPSGNVSLVSYFMLQVLDLEITLAEIWRITLLCTLQ